MPGTNPMTALPRSRDPWIPTVRSLTMIPRAPAIVYWSDAAVCHYGYQGWRVTAATSEGVCSLTGAPIHRGDSVYRPSQRDPKPQNAAAMILAAAMPQTQAGA